MPGQSPNPDPIRVLFFAEAVTLAHVARPVALALGLQSSAFDIHLARHPRYGDLLGDLPFTEHDIHSISPQQFTGALATGKALYDLATLKSYVEEDLRLIAELEPDVIVGDFRLSLAVSAELAQVPYIALGNAYWSPLCRQRFTVPDLPLTRILGTTLGQGIFSLARPFAFALHCVPMAKLRRSYGQDTLGYDLREVYTHGDYTLYADVSEFYHMAELPAHHRFIGPVTWSPSCALPDWWHSLPAERPVVYVTLGSSGAARLLPEVCRAMGQMDVTALVSTAGAPLPDETPDNVYIAAYLPGDEAVKKADLVICNGGSPGTHQALARGVPVIGICGNLDQYLNMAAVERVGAGLGLRGGQCEAQVLANAALQLLHDSVSHEAARSVAATFASYDAVAALRDVINEAAGGHVCAQGVAS